MMRLGGPKILQSLLPILLISGPLFGSHLLTSVRAAVFEEDALMMEQNAGRHAAASWERPSQGGPNSPGGDPSPGRHRQMKKSQVSIVARHAGQLVDHEELPNPGSLRQGTIRTTSAGSEVEKNSTSAATARHERDIYEGIQTYFANRGSAAAIGWVQGLLESAYEGARAGPVKEAIRTCLDMIQNFLEVTATLEQDDGIGWSQSIRSSGPANAKGRVDEALSALARRLAQRLLRQGIEAYRADVQQEDETRTAANERQAYVVLFNLMDKLKGEFNNYEHTEPMHRLTDARKSIFDYDDQIKHNYDVFDGSIANLMGGATDEMRIKIEEALDLILGRIE